ncbi:hypothetical protein Rt10032_c18g6068 [Rhodotorula toruloides]|uniref:Uncharacterized protein n=1 Tax=Rhodotorula toruloides TaxID=5286 RepID=A0A511KNY7_RHOTO|nr:hypothetical protein Rt10032_c18g6068 [Rhodotorula toruloides]
MNGITLAASPAPAQTGASAAAGGPSARGTPGPATTAKDAGERVALADKNVAILSLPSRDLPAYYDPPSSPSATSDPDLDDFDATHSHALPLSASHLVPTTNRGHKLSRLAPHTRRGRLGNYANVDAGFSDPTSSSSLIPPAQKRRKLNDLAPSSSTSGFPVAPNLHLIPRPVHSLSRESDEPYPSYLPPVPQSPLDLLLTPSIQHALGKRNNTFHLLGASATALIEQEAELVNALTKVCRGLRGEGFEWRWEGDEERKKVRAEERKKENEERERLKEKEQAALREREEEAAKRQQERAEKQAQEAQAAAAAEVEVAAAAEAEAKAEKAAAEAQKADEQRAQPADAQMVVDGAASHNASDEVPPIPAATIEQVKLEQATPVLQSAATPVEAPANPVVVPGISSSATPAAEPAQDADATMQEATPAEGTGQSSAATPAAASALDVPAIAVIGPASTADPSATATPVPAPNGDSTDTTPQAGEAAGQPIEPGTDTPAPADSAAVVAAEAGASEEARTNEATPAPSASAEELASRRRSGRVATRGHGAGFPGARHTRSRQSSPEDDGDYDSDTLMAMGVPGVEGEGFATGAAGEGEESLEGDARPKAHHLVPEEELPEYATRLIDPEVFVRDLFVSEGKVELERLVPGPAGQVVGTGQFDTLTPNEQEVLLHDCLTDLHRFLADTLEYRARLSEIRDGILGVERRRKGMWRVVRTVAMDWLEEEESGMGVGQNGEAYE